MTRTDDCLLQDWKETYYKASTSLQYRERKLEDAANLIENNLVLLGATAIEDKLQDQVSHRHLKADRRNERAVEDKNL